MSKTKETPRPPTPTTSLPPGLPVKRPRMLLCMICGYRTLERESFTDHCRVAHP